MNRTSIWMVACMLALALACGSDEAKKVEAEAKAAGSDVAAAADKAADATATAANDMAAKASAAAKDAAAEASAASAAASDAASKAAMETANALGGGSAVKECQALAAKGAWSEALDVCKKAHEMEPDNLALEHAYQQAKAAAQ